jgi:GNAT superfamily N-acetyltransferase
VTTHPEGRPDPALEPLLHDASLRCRPLAADDLPLLCSWRHAGPGAFYDLVPGDEERAAQALSADSPHFVLIDADQAVLGYFCVGSAARVAGGRYDESAVDLGLVLRPDLAGAGRGSVWTPAVLDFVARRFGRRVRVTIAAGNRPALRLAGRLGFRVAGGFGGFRHGGQPHVILIADTAPPGA